MRRFAEDTIRGVTSIVSHTTGSDRRSLLVTYPRLRLRQAIALAFPRVGFQRARVFGYDVRLTHPNAFLLMLDEIFVRGVYWFESASDRPRILDCGANIGLATMYFKRLFPDASVIAFEPNPETFALLACNVRENKIRDVQLVNKALSADDGAAEFFAEPERPFASSMIRGRVSGRAHPTRVETARLSQFINSEITFLKMDIEGVEQDALTELADSGKIRQVAAMAIEYHHHLDADRDCLAGFLSVLEQSGFGYQVAAPEQRTFGRECFQDILIRAYRKS